MIGRPAAGMLAWGSSLTFSCNSRATFLVVSLLLSAACGGHKAAPVPDPAATAGPGIAGIRACRAALTALDALEACAPNPDERALMVMIDRNLRELLGSTAAIDADATAQYARTCVGYLDDSVETMRWHRCAFRPSPEETSWIGAARTRRTGVPASARSDDRAALERVAAARDRACACKDPACADRAGRTLDGDGPTLDGHADAASRDAASAMIDELAACGHRLQRDATMAGPPPPSDPAAARAMLQQLEAHDQPVEPPAPAPPPVDSVTLPGGKTLRPADCTQVDEFERDTCLGLFTDVAQCRREPSHAKECESQAIADWVEANTNPDDPPDLTP